MSRPQIGETVSSMSCRKSTRRVGTTRWLSTKSRARRARTRCATITSRRHIFAEYVAGRGILLTWNARATRSSETHGRVLSPEVGFPLVGPSPSQVLTTSLPLHPRPSRAQKRIAQQRLDSRMPLKRIIDIRKKVFAEVKVRLSLFNLYREHLDSLVAEFREPRVSDWRRAAYITSALLTK